MSRLILVLLATLGILFPVSRDGQAAEFVIYSVYQSLNLGNEKEVPQKDFYINMGSLHGVREGSVIEVSRRVSTYDLVSQQLYRDMVFKVGYLKVIHVEPNAAIARLEKLLPPEESPAANPRAIMVGDLVQLAKETLRKRKG